MPCYDTLAIFSQAWSFFEYDSKQTELLSVRQKTSHVARLIFCAEPQQKKIMRLGLSCSQS